MGKHQFLRRESYTCLNPQIPGLVQAFGSSQANYAGIISSPARKTPQGPEKRPNHGKGRENDGCSGSGSDIDEDDPTSAKSQDQIQDPCDDERHLLRSGSGSGSQSQSQSRSRLWSPRSNSNRNGNDEGSKWYSSDVIGDLKRNLDIDDHKIKLHDLCRRLGTNEIIGLTRFQVHVNRDKYGENMLTPPKETPEWQHFLRHALGGFSFLLIIGSVICFYASFADSRYIYLEDQATEYMYLGIVLVAVVFISGLFSYYQETKSTKIMDSFKKMVPQVAIVIREGAKREMNITDLVVGDVVEIKAGDKIPADLRIIDSVDLKVDNSTLTGDSEAQSRSAECTHDNPLKTKNLCFFSANAVEGHGRGVVINVGDGTFIGRIAGCASKLEHHTTPMTEEIASFVRIISTVSIFFGVAFFGASVCQGNSWLNSVVFLIGIIVANVPEGLLATITICIALTAKRMASKNCLVKHLEAVETLGFTNCICVDKTGILTLNKMEVSHMWYNDQIHDFEPTGDIFLRWLKSHLIDVTCPGFVALTTVGALCSRARFKPDQFGVSLEKRSHILFNPNPIINREVIGDSTEAGILKCMQMFVGHIEFFQKQQPKIWEIPFNATNKFQVSIHKKEASTASSSSSSSGSDAVDDQSYYLLVMKGAAELVFEHCKTILVNDQEFEIDEEWRRKFECASSMMCNMGERAVGFCDARLSKDKYPLDTTNFDSLFLSMVEERSFRFVGIMSLLDPVRSNVPDSVEKCKSAGIKMIMITGDHPLTAKAIARAIGIISEGSMTVDEVEAQLRISRDAMGPGMVKAVVVHGDDLKDMEPTELDSILKNHDEIVFARTCPQQKLMIVEGCQRLGWIVAITGDCVNDSPALRKADVGIALGLVGSDVAKDAADLILLDDNFGTIVNGVEEGRRIFDNLKKCVFYSLTDNIAELAHFFIFLFARIPLPLGTLANLCIDLGTDIVPSISLSYEKGDADLMKRAPRDPRKDGLVSPQLISYGYGQIGMIETFAGFYSYFIIMAQNGFLPYSLLGIGDRWDSAAVNDLTDSYGQEWTYTARKRLEGACSTAYFVAIVVTQWSNLIICKTRRSSVFTSSFRNNVLTFALVFETFIACFLIYTPGMATALNLVPLKFVWWLPALPFSFLILFYDELRCYLVRRFPGGWAAGEFSF